MSKKVIHLQGRTENLDNLLLVSSFYGGDGRGKCIQLSLDNDYIQLERSDIYELVEALSEWLKVN